MSKQPKKNFLIYPPAMASAKDIIVNDYLADPVEDMAPDLSDPEEYSREPEGEDEIDLDFDPKAFPPAFVNKCMNSSCPYWRKPFSNGISCPNEACVPFNAEIDNLAAENPSMGEKGRRVEKPFPQERVNITMLNGGFGGAFYDKPEEDGKQATKKMKKGKGKERA
ncbi:Protein of unknown function [Pyronema omphalodes CBS 100304]|uniref:Uncharacterized protein n=1 Tax=Pyronema omphalodes (strain CBS 100304) TaxID=1076935 RepID=U4LA90_PYROM|nr:Protein of unknown function [Pyronema omphalodes CBS 100304]